MATNPKADCGLHLALTLTRLGSLDEKENTMHHIDDLTTRRDLLLKGGAGFGAIALNYLLRDDPAFAAPTPEPAASPLAVKTPHFAARAKRVIFLFMEGGPSHIDLFDPKPKLNELAGKPLPPSFTKVITSMGEINAPLLASKRKWKQHGQCGTWVSDWLPHIAGHVDDIAV